MSEEDRLKLENKLLLTKSKAQMINLYLDLQQKVEVKNERIKEEQQEKERYIKFYNGLNIWNKDLQQKVEQLEKEIERLNNIINELEKYIGQEWYCFDNESIEFEVARDILDKLKKLKENK